MASSPYGSSQDLPSVREMLDQIKAGKLLTRFIGRAYRPQLLELEAEVLHLTSIVDRFYDRLGPRNWIFHDQLNVSEVERLLQETTDAAGAEQRLISLCRDKKATRFWLTRLQNVDGLRERIHQLQRARQHYDQDEFDSCALHLIAVMDGFVNDFDPSLRKGLSSREPDEMTAWDSVVGHHMGLTHAMTSFRKGIRKRIDEEVFELYRNGIMHGAITRYDNVIVATKAWNMLFAVVDWAAATTKSRIPKEAAPTLREALSTMARTADLKKRIEKWRPVSLATGDQGFLEHRISRITREFLTTWQSQNFGSMTDFTGSLAMGNATSKPQMAGLLRDRFRGTLLSEFEVTELQNEVPAIWIAKGRATVNDRAGSFSCRWTTVDERGSADFDVDSADWRLVFCDPWSIWRAPD